MGGGNNDTALAPSLANPARASARSAIRSSATPPPFPVGNDIVRVSCTEPTELNCPCVGRGLLDTDIDGLGDLAIASAGVGAGVRMTCWTPSESVRLTVFVVRDNAPSENRTVTGISTSTSRGTSSATSSTSSGSAGTIAIGEVTLTAVALVAVEGVPGRGGIDMGRTRGEAGVYGTGTDIDGLGLAGLEGGAPATD